MNPYEEGRIYKGSIVDQTVCTRERGGGDDVQIALSVQITARLKDDNNPGGGTEECASHERQVTITLPTNDQERLRMAVRDVARLGFDHDDVAMLHPEHPQFV